MYTYVLHKISELCDKMGHLFSPPNLIRDFEIAILKAIDQVRQGMDVFGCRFHWTQAWFRQTQSLSPNVKISVILVWDYAIAMVYYF